MRTNYLIKLSLLLFVMLFGIIGNSFGQYCVPQYDYPCYQNTGIATADYINNFSTSNGITNIVNNNTACNGQPNNFIYYSNMTVTATQGCSFNVSMQSGDDPITEFPQGFGIWIDWNQDLDYSDAGEFVYNSGGYSFNVYNGTIQVPPTALVGTTRMRVRCTYFTVPTNPCSLQGGFAVGEVEEYNVNVVSNTASNVQVSGQTICAGTSTTVTATAQGIIRWYLNPTSTTQIAMGPTFTTPVLNTTTTYYVQATFGPCTTPRVPVTITVIPPFSLNVTASQNPVCAGSPFTLTATGGTNLTYSWSPATAFTDATANPATATIAGNTTFTVTGTNAIGCHGTGTITVNALPAATLNISGTADEICPGGTSTISVSGGSTYNWTPTASLSASTGSSVVATPTSTTTYIVTSPASSSACAATANFTVTVNPLPAVSAGLDATYCAGGQANLLATGAATYSWSPALGLSSTSIDNPIASPTTTTTYTVTGTSADGCVASDQVIVNVNSLPIANPGNGAANCSGNGAQLLGSGGTSYLWSPATGLSDATISNPVATPASTTNYTLVVTDFNGCVSNASSPITVTVFNQPAAPVITPGGTNTICSGDNIVLSSSYGSSYLWSNGATTSTVTVTQSGTFNLRIIDANGCVSPPSANSIVIVNQTPVAPIVNAVGSTTFCQGSTATLQANQNSGITWNNGLTTSSITVNTTGQYTATYTDPNGCISPSSAPVQINVTPLASVPSISASGPTEFCEGSTVTLTASNGAESYLWSNGATSQAIEVLASGNYTVTIGATCPPANPTASQNVIVRPIPVPVISADIRRECLPAEINFGATTVGIGPFSYTWTFGDGQTATSSQPAHEYVNDGFYTISLKLVDVIGCTGLATEVNFIEILEKPLVNFVISPEVTTLSKPDVQLLSFTNGGLDEEWTVDVLGDFTGDSVQLTMPDTGTYLVNYQVTTEQGCQVKLKGEIVVVDDFQIFVPTGFTPNADGLNDVFVPICSGCARKGFEFKVFNRWGQELFTADKPNVGWDPGEAPLDTYIWRISARSLLGEDRIVQGNITLIK